MRARRRNTDPRWTDTNIYNEIRIPAMKLGRRIGPRNEKIGINVMLKAAHIYALMSLDIYSWERPSSRPS